MHMTYIKRGKTSIPALFGKYQCEYIAVLAGSGLTIHFPENQQHTFHFVSWLNYVYYVYNAVKEII